MLDLLDHSTNISPNIIFCFNQYAFVHAPQCLVDRTGPFLSHLSNQMICEMFGDMLVPFDHQLTT